MQNDALVELGQYLKSTIINNDAYHSGYRVSKTATPKSPATVKVKSKTVVSKPQTYTELWNELIKNFSEPVMSFKTSILEESKPEQRQTVENAISLFTSFLGQEV